MRNSSSAIILDVTGGLCRNHSLWSWLDGLYLSIDGIAHARSTGSSGVSLLPSTNFTCRKRHPFLARARHAMDASSVRSP